MSPTPPTPDASSTDPSGTEPSSTGTTSSSEAPPFDAIVLAGGLARRFEGASKPDVEVDGRRMLDHVLAAVAGARRIVLVAPESVALRDGADAPVDPERVHRTMEDPPRGGPAAGLAAGLEALGRVDVAEQDGGGVPEGADVGEGADLPLVVLSCDVPRVASAVPRLLATLNGADTAHSTVDGVCLVTADPERGSRRQPLVAAYRPAAMRGALATIAAQRGTITGASIREVVARLDLSEVPAQGSEGIDVDSWADLDALGRSGA